MKRLRTILAVSVLFAAVPAFLAADPAADKRKQSLYFPEEMLVTASSAEGDEHPIGPPFRDVDGDGYALMPAIRAALLRGHTVTLTRVGRSESPAGLVDYEVETSLILDKACRRCAAKSKKTREIVVVGSKIMATNHKTGATLAVRVEQSRAEIDSVASDLQGVVVLAYTGGEEERHFERVIRLRSAEDLLRRPAFRTVMEFARRFGVRQPDNEVRAGLLLPAVKSAR